MKNRNLSLFLTEGSPPRIIKKVFSFIVTADEWKTGMKNEALRLGQEYDKSLTDDEFINLSILLCCRDFLNKSKKNKIKITKHSDVIHFEDDRRNEYLVFKKH